MLPRTRSTKAGGKSGEAVADLERNAGFGRSVGVTDDGLRKGAVQAVEDHLVGDFAGQPDAARRNIPRIAGDISAGANVSAFPTDA